ncbi:hypothetical protein BGX26_006053 [Mortierella sp. AD094]|nr:hypothetical protein BGX26_006053 [Mortierella sp. AD094]
MAHPLEIPEIVSLVGKFVPVWFKSPDDYYNHRFYPKDILNCCLVSHTWRSSMLPWLWAIFDEKFMTKVPRDVFLKYLAYFKVVGSISSGHTLSRALTQSNGLRSIKMSGWNTNAVTPLLNAHPGLRRLSFYITDTYIGPAITHSLSNLHNLTELDIRQMTLTFTDLLTILENKPRLQTLSLCSVEIKDGPSKHSPGLGSTSLTTLHILSKKVDLDVIHRLLECSRALRSFSIDLDCELECPIGASDISNALQKNCPSLESLTVRGRYDDIEVDLLIYQVSPLVKEISVEVDYLEESTLRSIAARANVVEKLTLRTSDMDGEGLERILSCCCRLKELHIVFDLFNDYSDEYTQILCNKPWSSTDLTHISIRGLELPINTATRMLPQGWILFPADNSYSGNLRWFFKYSDTLAAHPLVPHFDTQLLAALDHMPHIQEVVVNELKYTRGNFGLSRK